MPRLFYVLPKTRFLRYNTMRNHRAAFVMTTAGILTVPKREIHTTVFASVDDDNLPQGPHHRPDARRRKRSVCLHSEGEILLPPTHGQPYVALRDTNGTDTLSSIAIVLRGRVRCTGRERLDEVFRQKPYMAKICPVPESREALVAFQLHQSKGEQLDLSRLPPFRQSFRPGGRKAQERIHRIAAEKCIGRTSCLSACPTCCISEAVPRAIAASHCLHACPAHAIERS